MDRVQTLLKRIKDKRSKQVVFLSHCILNENTRYLGGACTGCFVPEIMDSVFKNNLGVVQMPCPEQHAWGGVNKRMLLLAYGAKGTILYNFRYIIIPALLLYTRVIYRWIARKKAREIQDYINSGYSVTAIVGIDGSPSCGVNTTLDFWKAFEVLAEINVNSVTLEDANAVVTKCLTDGQGLFTIALQDELRKRHISIPYLAHDLIAEIKGNKSDLGFPSQTFLR
ncbi:MAG: hypothetical protein NT072_10715 [Deltaproteobacteria bacterium]|nr:hypothetical protein [Deltaproteobacteria bacterium]